MDWGEDMHSNMWVLPAGMKRDGMGGANSIQWESKYGSLVVPAYDIGSSDGINEKGLTVNMLDLVESDYGKPAAGGKVICMRPGRNISSTFIRTSSIPSLTSARRSSAYRPSSCSRDVLRTCTSRSRTPRATPP